GECLFNGMFPWLTRTGSEPCVLARARSAMPNMSRNLGCPECQRLQETYRQTLREWGMLQAEHRLSGIMHTKRARHTVEEAEARMNAAAEEVERHQSSCIACQTEAEST